MATKNRVIWNEGLFIKPQHFQQQQRHIDYTINSYFSAISDHIYGLQLLELNEEYLNFGRIGIVRAAGIMPDGTVFNIPFEDVQPRPLEIDGDNYANQRVYLALPLINEAINEVYRADGVKEITSHKRWSASRNDIRDLHSEQGDVAAIELAQVNMRLMLEAEDRSGYASIAIARILDKQPDGSLLLDNNFLPTCLCVSAANGLKRFLNETSGLITERAKNLAERIGAPGQQGVADVAEFMMLQIMNRIQPQFTHLASLSRLHPERLYEALVQACGELMTFTDESRLPPQFEAYRHDDLQLCFVPVMRALRQTLSTVLSPRAVSLQLQPQAFGLFVAVVNERELLQSAEFILAVRARMPLDVLRKQFTQQTKIASPENVRQLVAHQLPGLPLIALPVAPRQLPYHAGYTYFQLDRRSSGWQELAKGSGLAFHVAGEFPELDMQLWAIRSQ